MYIYRGPGYSLQNTDRYHAIASCFYMFMYSTHAMIVVIIMHTYTRVHVVPHGQPGHTVMRVMANYGRQWRQGTQTSTQATTQLSESVAVD